MTDRSGTETVLELFGGISKAEWLAKIEADLRGKAMEETEWVVDSDTRISPFAHPEHSPNSSRVSYNPDWEIAEYFKVNDAAVSNQTILSALQGGCETVLIEVDGIEDWDVLFRDISLEMIKTYIIPSQDEQTELLIKSLTAWLDNDAFGDIEISVRPPGGLQLGTSSLEDRTVTDDLAKTVLAGIDLIESGYEGDFVECIAQIGVSYFVEIARLRALQILWQNTITALERNRPGLVIEAHFADRDMSDDQYINMISASTKALSAICGGADRLVIAPSSPDASDFHRRISRNVHHLLKFETKLDSVMDPVAGSFYIEGMVNQFASEAWAKVLSALD